jgi:hypothetical protein
LAIGGAKLESTKSARQKKKITNYYYYFIILLLFYFIIFFQELAPAGPNSGPPLVLISRVAAALQPAHGNMSVYCSLKDRFVIFGWICMP